MNLRTKSALLLGVVLAWGAVEATAQAQMPGPFGAPNYLYFLPSNLYPNADAAGSPPYFSIHPPVYYSYPVPRPYGFSPFAYPPGFTTPSVDFPTPNKVMRNPYVPRKRELHAPADKTAQAMPRLIVNPYVEQAGSVADRVAAMPEVVRPERFEE